MLFFLISLRPAIIRKINKTEKLISLGLWKNRLCSLKGLSSKESDSGKSLMV